MMLPTLRRAALAAALFVFSAVLLAQVAVPPLKSRVTDLTGTLSAQQRSALEERLAAFETRKGSQLAVLLMPTTEPEAIEQYGIRVADQWKIGRTGVTRVDAARARRKCINMEWGRPLKARQFSRVGCK